MGSIEAGRGTLKYIGETAVGALGITTACAAYRENRKFGREVPIGERVFGEKPRENGVLYSLEQAYAYGLGHLLLPLTAKAFREASMAGKVNNNDRAAIAAIYIDLLAIGATVAVGFTGHLWEAAVVKIGYNLLVEIAPDVANLAKRGILQRTK